jgi:hypothetical protein
MKSHLQANIARVLFAHHVTAVLEHAQFTVRMPLVPTTATCRCTPQQMHATTHTSPQARVLDIQQCRLQTHTCYRQQVAQPLHMCTVITGLSNTLNHSTTLPSCTGMVDAAPGATRAVPLTATATNMQDLTQPNDCEVLRALQPVFHMLTLPPRQSAAEVQPACVVAQQSLSVFK